MDKLKEYINSQNYEISEKQLASFKHYYEMLIEKNKVMNLTAITKKDEVILKHFIDSISMAFSIKSVAGIKEKNLNLIDIGTGAGFPGIPLKIMFPDLNVTLLDSLNKRVTFLNEVIAELGLKNITAIHSRAEEGARDKSLRDHFDIAVSRAVANLPVLLEYTLPFVKKDGCFISYKSGDIDEELESSKHALKCLNGTIIEDTRITLPDSDIKRSFVVVKKTAPTPKAYPRKAGTARKEPL